MDGRNNGIVLYHYSFSPYARRVTWYLALRGIDYAQCNQPPYLPRPDLKLLGVSYRRIPLMAIGRDIYCDSRIIIDKLEKLFPNANLGASQPDQRAVQKLLEVWNIEAGLFVRAGQLIPTSMPLLNDPKFTNDREDYSGRSWKKEQIEANRPEAMAHVRNAFRFLETTLLADDRDWILKTEKPTLADIEAVWVFDWLKGLKGALDKDLISEKQYPKVYAYLNRFSEAVKAAKSVAAKPTTLKGEEALRRIIGAKFAEEQILVDEKDPLKLKKGTEIEVWPTDSGVKHRDRGQLVGLTEDEVVIQVKTQSEGRGSPPSLSADRLQNRSGEDYRDFEIVGLGWECKI